MEWEAQHFSLAEWLLIKRDFWFWVSVFGVQVSVFFPLHF